eukprot:TRINITY_DN768_c0_g1_i1.p1 TRINITY_DN768_c0_g1~~TRINITY_DN768_c0_g1_i1.p1  ORF type:complete len:953 (+),score=221.10 TRINITY_DN768_c0_g1_i1:6332-9190(+)
MGKEKVMLVVGLLLMLHAAYSQLNCKFNGTNKRLVVRKELRAKRGIENISFVEIPIDILVELVLGLCISVFSGAYTFGMFQNVKAADHIKKTPQSEFDYTKKFYTGKTTLAAAVNECLPQELTNLDPAQKNPTLAKYIGTQQQPSLIPPCIVIIDSHVELSSQNNIAIKCRPRYYIKQFLRSNNNTQYHKLCCAARMNKSSPTSQPKASKVICPVPTHIVKVSAPRSPTADTSTTIKTSSSKDLPTVSLKSGHTTPMSTPRKRNTLLSPMHSTGTGMETFGDLHGRSMDIVPGIAIGGPSSILRRHGTMSVTSQESPSENMLYTTEEVKEKEEAKNKEIRLIRVILEKTQATAKKEKEEFNATLAKMQEEKREYDTKIKELSEAEEKYKTQVLTLEVEVNESKKKITEAQEVLGKTSEKCKGLEERVKTLENLLEKSKAELDESKHKKVQLENDYAKNQQELTAKLDAKSKELSETSAKLLECKNSLQKAEDQLLELKKSFNEEKEKRETTYKELEKVKEERKGLQKKYEEECLVHEKDVKEVQTELDKVKGEALEKNNLLAKLNTEAKGFAEKYKETEKELETVKASKEQLNVQYNEKTVSLETQLKNLAQKMESKTNDMVKLSELEKTHVAKLKEYDESEKALKAQLDILTTKNKELDAEKTSCVSQIEKLCKDHDTDKAEIERYIKEISQCKKVEEKLCSEKEEIEKKVEALQKDLEQKLEIEGKVATLNQTINEVKAKNAKLENDKKNYMEKLKELSQKSSNAADAEKTLLREEKEKCMEEIKVLQKVINDIRAENDKLQEIKGIYEKQIQEYKEKIKAAGNIEAVKAEIKEAKDKNAKLSQEKSKLEAEMAETREKATKLQEEVEKYKNKEQEYKKERATLNSKHEKMANEVKGLEAALKKAKEVSEEKEAAHKKVETESLTLKKFQETSTGQKPLVLGSFIALVIF